MFLIETRAGCACEVKGPNCTNSYLWGHHIVKRSEFRDDSAQNIIIACSKCHDHALYPDTGIPVTAMDAKIIVHKRNQSCNIRPFLIGDDL